MTGIVVVAISAAYLASAARAHPQQGAEKSAEHKSTLDRVYSDAQAKRGRSIFNNNCSQCHMEDLSGRESAPALAGDAFVQDWGGRTLADLFERIRTTMPQDAPGKLSTKAYIGVVSFLLKANGFPSGTDDLQDDSDTLKQILNKKK